MKISKAFGSLIATVFTCLLLAACASVPVPSSGSARGFSEVLQPANIPPASASQSITEPVPASFTTDNMYAGESGEVLYSYALPTRYDANGSYPLVVTLPGYGGRMVSPDADIDVYADRGAVAWTELEEDAIVLTPHLTGWGEESALQTIELVEHFIGEYAVDANRVYGMGFSAGGETMSRVMSQRAELFAAYLHIGSQWNGEFDAVVENRLPVYIFIGEEDEYYGAEQAVEDANTLRALYEAEKLAADVIDRLVVLDIKDDAYFEERGISSHHGGGVAAYDDATVVNWVMTQRT